MNKISGILLAVFIIILILVTGCSSGSTGSSGNTAPDFELYGLDGNVYSLAQFRGSPVLLNFWATWCPPCRREMPYLQTVYRMWADTELVFFTVNIGEDASTIQGYLDAEGLDLPVLMDTTKSVATKYGVNAIPTTFLIDGDGIIQKMKIGYFESEDELEDFIIDVVK